MENFAQSFFQPKPRGQKNLVSRVDFLCEKAYPRNMKNTNTNNQQRGQQDAPTTIVSLASHWLCVRGHLFEATYYPLMGVYEIEHGGKVVALCENFADVRATIDEQVFFMRLLDA